MRHFAWLAPLLLLTAGCVESSEPLATPAESRDPSLPDFRPIEDTPVQEAPRTLEAAPQWKQGEWWKVRLKDLTGATYEVTRIVAGQEGDDYLVGMPGDSFSDDLMVLHLPGFGQVSKEDLSYEVHNVRFEPLRFPLTDGATWQTAFEGSPLNAVVHSINETRARVQLDGSIFHINVTYDATIGEIVEYRHKGYADYDVIEHGFGYSKLVTVPHMFKLVFMNFRIGQVMDGGLEPKPLPSDTVKVDSGYDRVSFVLLYQSITGGAAAGVYEIKATAPDKKTYQLSVGPGGAALALKTYAQDFPGGDWTFDYVAIGPGAVGAEGIAYHVYDIEMPSGRILPSEGEHQHGHH